MKRIDVKEHTRKHMEYGKKLATKRYPRTEVTVVGTTISFMIGFLTILLGIFSFLFYNHIFGISLFVIGLITEISNYVMYQNLKKK